MNASANKTINAPSSEAAVDHRVKSLSGAGSAKYQDGYAFKIFKRADIQAASAIALHEAGIGVTLGVSQSNGSALSGARGGPIWDGNSAPFHNLMIPNSLEHYGSELWATHAKPSSDFTPLAQTNGHGIAPLLMTAEALFRFDRVEGRDSQPRVFAVSWKGDTKLEHFFPGSPDSFIHENALEELVRIKAIALHFPMPVRLDAIEFCQGENRSLSPWGDLFRRWLNSIVPLYAEVMNQAEAPSVLFMQTNTPTVFAQANGNEREQLRIARESDKSKVALVGPMYQYAFHEGSSSHLDDLSRMMRGEIAAIAHDRLVRQKLDWNPLWPIEGAVKRFDNIIIIPMQLPPGCSKLEFDDDMVHAVTNRGFTFSQTGGNSPNIQAVSISGKNVVVMLDALPTGENKTISYAIDNGANTPGWATGRGQLYAPDSRMSVWWPRGYRVSKYPRHYCVRFTEAVP